jgi:hypothetical protein
MKPLPDSFAKNGFTYEKIMREGNLAIYQQRLRPGAGCLAFEVFRVRESKGGTYTVGGKTLTAMPAETGPSNEDFGKTAWSYPALERAKAKFRALLEAPARVLGRPKNRGLTPSSVSA